MGKGAEELPGYRLGEPIHASSASAVYRAHRKADGARVVIKRSHGSAVSARQLTRYRNEYELLCSLNSSGVIKALDLIRHEGQIALILEELAGCSLRQWLETSKSSGLNERLKIAIRLAAIVAEVHRANIIHKDISSHNVVYDAATGECKLIDFGIATRLRSEEKKFQAPAGLEGTLAYIAPEQTGRMNRSLDYRADLYSLGVTLYELFTGNLPHDSADPLEMVHFHIAGKAVPPSERDAHVPNAISAIVMKLMQKEPEHRYQSAAGLVVDLRNCLAQLEATGRILPFALAAHDAVDRFEPPQKLYGRSSETQTLLHSFERVARGGVEVVLVSGQGGVGKTSLVQEIYQPITRQRGYFAAGKFDQLQQNVPFSGLVVALQDLVQQLLTENAESIARWRAAIQAAVHPNAQLMIDVVPALELIIGPQPKVVELEAFEAQNRFNLVFQSFVQVFCKKSHPLVLFLDDMQWADPASLNLVTLIVSARATESLLLVMTYRDNEMSSTHPFMLAVKEQSKQGIEVHSIELKPLQAADVAEFVADALHQDIAAALPLARIVHRKTGGNPFFMRQFLQALHAQKLIHFDSDDKAFRCDAAAVESAAITENVAEFLASKLEKMPAQTREVLRVAAAIGNRFALQTLASVYRRPAEDAVQDLQPAIDDGLIVPISGLESLDFDGLKAPLIYRRFAFLHDRVQQAAYATLLAGEGPALHLAIGRVLLNYSPDAVDGRLFDIVNHLNQGMALLEDPEERLHLAQLNIKAGTKARNSTAYSLAVHSFDHTIELLGPQAWSQNYALSFDAHSRLAEGLCLTADYARAFEVIDAALEHITAVIDRASLYSLKTSVHLSMGHMPEALACGRATTALFGIDLPEEREQVQQMLQTEIRVILERTAAIGIESLLDLPLMTDPIKIASMPVLAHCLPAAYQSNQEQYALICCKMVGLSLDHGNCPLSARAYGSFAALLSSVLGNYRDAYRFGKLGVDLCHRLNDVSVLPSAYFLWAMFASHWNKPVEESIELYRQSVVYALQTGDHQHAGYSAARRISHLQFRGMPLAELHAEAAEALELLHRIGDPTNVGFLLPRMRLMNWLRGDRRHGDTLGSGELTEAQCTAQIQARGNKSFESDWFMQLTKQRYLCGDFEAAYEFAEKAEGLQPFSAGFITRGEHNFYYALTLAALYDDADRDRRALILTLLAKKQEQLGEWAGNCPQNLQAMYSLVEAERARIASNRLAAMDSYDRAITAARAYGLVNVEALAAELAARFWFAEQKPEFGRLCLEMSLHAYEIWGAFGRIADLKVTFGLNVVRGATASTTGSTTSGGSTERGDSLDLATVLKASQAISGEIVLERLFGTLIDIILENAGADSGALILDTDGQLMVRSAKSADAARAAVTAVPLDLSEIVSSGVVNYVVRTREHLVLADPAAHGKFRNDRYVRERRPKSVLCAPIVHKGQLQGVIYLENNQVAGAFTPGRLEALNILLSQIAVSIENATLYAKQEQQTRAIEAANVTLTREIIERNRAEQELSRYKDHLEELVKERTKELESAQGRLVDLSRRAGMAEVASGVLHNVGNVMNSVNVGASVTRDAVKALPVEGLSRACELLDQNAGRIGEYLRSDAIGRKLPEYLRRLGSALATEKQGILTQIDQLAGHLEHMKKIIAAQQSYAKVNGVTEVCTLEEIAESALAISEAALRNSGIQIVRDYEEIPAVLIDRHQIMQILVNLISNAKHAIEEHEPKQRELTVAVARVDGGVRIEVRDNGVGILPENLAKIFNHGFTTKKTGHGFGLHNAANAAQQMHGSLSAHSNGPGCGASFVLRLPVEYADQAALHAGFGHARGSA